MSSPFDYWDNTVLRDMAELLAAIPNATSVRIFPSIDTSANPSIFDPILVVVYTPTLYGEVYKYARIGTLVPASVYNDPDQHAAVVTRLDGYVQAYIATGNTPTPPFVFPNPITPA